MNEQGSKKILFNKCTLLSLKAELFKKQEEVLEKKQLPQHRVENFKLPKHICNKNEKNSVKEEKRNFKDNLKSIDTEELEACRKAKLALEKKTNLYEHLLDSAGNSQLASNFLVDFNTKKQQELVTAKPIAQHIPVPEKHDENEFCNEDENEWTEFTDCLGRTRKCLKSDIEFYLKRDRELLRAMTKDPQHSDDNGTLDDENGRFKQYLTWYKSTLKKVLKEKTKFHKKYQVYGDFSDKHLWHLLQHRAKRLEKKSNQLEKSFLVQKTNDYLRSLREKWEQKERELLAMGKDIHYQDLLYDEARMHGVGYYSFSTDETERRRQMAELMKQREETQRAQRDAEEQRKRRDELVAARVAAARARNRARAGLPVEDPQENQKDFTAHLLEFLTQQRNEAELKAKEEEKKLKDEQEKERQKLREAYVREWDIGKAGVEEKVKKFREMTQEEYVEQQRAKRIDEFAPLQTLSNDQSDNSFDDKGKMKTSDGGNVSMSAKTWSDVRPKAKTPPPPVISDITALPEQKGLYFSTVKKCGVKYKNFIKNQEPTLIVNELNDELVANDDLREREKRGIEASHAQIAPPPTYEYYGPVSKKSRPQKPFESDIREAYAQGAKSLEAKASNRQLPKHYDFTFN